MKKRLALSLVMILSLTGLAGCKKADQSTFENKKVRVVIGSTSTTGDSYMIADMAMRYLSKELKADAKVGAVGAGPAFDAIGKAKPDGSTLMMFHDMTYLGISFGAFDKKYALENMVVGPRIGLNLGGCFAAVASAPYENMKEMADYLKTNPDKKIRVAVEAVEAGGVSHIDFISYYEWVVKEYGQGVADRIRVVVGGSTAEKSQMLWDKNTDVIFADYSSLLQYTDAAVQDKLKMKFVGLLDKIDGTNIPTFAELGVTLDGKPFAFSKEFVIYLPKETPQALVDQLDVAAEKITKDQAFIDEMAKATYKASYMSSKDAKTHLYEKRDSLDALIKAAPSLDVLTQ